jgi:low temperature requirement protein LtrA
MVAPAGAAVIDGSTDRKGGLAPDPDLLAAIVRNARSALTGAALIIAAGFVHGGRKPTLWLTALAVGFFGPLLGGTGGWRVQPAHSSSVTD